MEAFLIAAGTTFIAEFGDKSQLLAIVLAARFRDPRAVIAGMGLGLLLNHLLAAAVGALLARFLPDELLRWLIGGGFLLAAAWALFGPLPGRGDGDDEAPAAAGSGPFLATAITFFIVEMGDKTQLMVAGLVARFAQPLLVVAGAWIGIMLALVPAALLADRLLTRLPVRIIRLVSALVFAGVGVATLLG